MTPAKRRRKPVKDAWWEFVKRTAAKVAKWPKWKIGGESVRSINRRQP